MKYGVMIILFTPIWVPVFIGCFIMCSFTCSGRVATCVHMTAFSNTMRFLVGDAWEEHGNA